MGNKPSQTAQPSGNRAIAAATPEQIKDAMPTFNVAMRKIAGVTKEELTRREHAERDTAKSAE